MLTDVRDVEHSTMAVLKHLDDMEVTWSKSQKEKKKQWLKENLQKKVRAQDFIDQLLVKCKQHRGPVTSVKELKELVTSTMKPAELKMFLRQEVQYQRMTHQRDSDIRRDLYKVNRLGESEMIENLTILLGDESKEEEGVVFTCEEEIVEVLRGRVQTEITPEEPEFLPNQPLAVIWDEGGTKQWYVGFYLDQDEDEGCFRVDHLTRTGPGDEVWQRPPGSDDVQEVIQQQVVPVALHGSWDFSNLRKPQFIVTNTHEVVETFHQISQSV